MNVDPFAAGSHCVKDVRVSRDEIFLRPIDGVEKGDGFRTQRRGFHWLGAGDSGVVRLDDLPFCEGFERGEVRDESSSCLVRIQVEADVEDGSCEMSQECCKDL